MSLIATALDEDALARLGQEMHRFASALYHTRRSITGDGLRRTLADIDTRIPLQMSEVPSGSHAFDWTVPKEWNIGGAYIKGPDGTVVSDLKESSLHVVNYSIPVHAKMRLSALKAHLFSLPDKPDWIPYRTSYYQEDWGFCLAHRKLVALQDGEYEVSIDSTLENGCLTYGECCLAGESEAEILISCHICHPSLANDNLSGLVVATWLAKLLSARTLRYSYRFLFLPGTIGAITWLSRNADAAARVRDGLVLTCVGDAKAFHYKKSRQGTADVDRAAEHVLRHASEGAEVLEFSPYGYDERQYCSPAFNLPVGCLMRSVWGTFPEYHSSGDNLGFIKPEALAGSLRACAAIVDVLEENRRYITLHSHCEPQLGRRGLYGTQEGGTGQIDLEARRWVLNLSDGDHCLLDIAERAGLPFSVVWAAAKVLEHSGLLAVLREADGEPRTEPSAQAALV